jgi:CheY-like chemotaxis protein
VDEAAIQVVLVEDEVLLLTELSEALTAAGFTVLEASTGAQAYGLLDREGENVRALITDINLGGGIDGWAVAHHARKINPQLPVIYTTSYNADVWAANGVPNSVHIAKPFVSVQVVTALSQLLNTSGPPAPG